MMNCKLASVAILVQDMDRSKTFYRDIMGMEIEMDFGLNVGFKGGLSIWQRQHAHQNIFDRPATHAGTNDNIEIYYESADIQSSWASAQKEGISLVHGLREQPWRQLVFRCSDPDGFIIEVGETIPDLVKRLAGEGLSPEKIEEQTMMPLEIVRAILA